MNPPLHYYQVTLPETGGCSLLLAGGPALSAKAGTVAMTKPNGEPILSVPEDRVRELTRAEFESLLAEEAHRRRVEGSRRN